MVAGKQQQLHHQKNKIKIKNILLLIILAWSFSMSAIALFEGLLRSQQGPWVLQQAGGPLPAGCSIRALLSEQDYYHQEQAQAITPFETRQVFDPLHRKEQSAGNKSR